MGEERVSGDQEIGEIEFVDLQDFEVEQSEESGCWKGGLGGSEVLTFKPIQL